MGEELGGVKDILSKLHNETLWEVEFDGLFLQLVDLDTSLQFLCLQGGQLSLSLTQQQRLIPSLQSPDHFPLSCFNNFALRPFCPRAFQFSIVPRGSTDDP